MVPFGKWPIPATLGQLVHMSGQSSPKSGVEEDHDQLRKASRIRIQSPIQRETDWFKQKSPRFGNRVQPKMLEFHPLNTQIGRTVSCDDVFDQQRKSSADIIRRNDETRPEADLPTFADGFRKYSRAKDATVKRYGSSNTDATVKRHSAAHTGLASPVYSASRTGISSPIFDISDDEPTIDSSPKPTTNLADLRKMVHVKLIQMGDAVRIIDSSIITMTLSLDSTISRFSYEEKAGYFPKTILFGSSNVKWISGYFGKVGAYLDLRLAQVPSEFADLLGNISLEPLEYDPNFEPAPVTLKDISPAPSTSMSRKSARVSTPIRSAIPRTDRNPRTLFTFPPMELDAVTITSNELLHLPEGVYLNDSLIQFDLKLILQQTSEKVGEITHIFSSFFFRKLLDKNQVDSVTKCNIFEKTFVFVPINEQYSGVIVSFYSLHWYLAMIFNPSAALLERKDDGNNSESESQEESEISLENMCIIVIFDSLGSKHRRGVTERLKTLIVDEAKWKKQTEIDKKVISAIYPRFPLQQNLTDCGCFLLEYVQRFLQNPDEIMTRILQKEDLSNWFTPDDAALRRLNLRNTIEDFEQKYGNLTEANQLSASSDIEEIIPHTLE